MKNLLFRFTPALLTLTPTLAYCIFREPRVVNDTCTLKNPNFSAVLENFAQQNFPHIRFSKFAPSAVEVVEQKAKPPRLTDK